MSQVQPDALGELASVWWLLAAVGVCLPVCIYVFVHIGRWWVTSLPLPLPLDRAYPAVPYPAWVGLVLFVGLQALAVAAALAFLAAGEVGLFPAPAAGAPDMVHPTAVILAQIVPLVAGLVLLRAFGRGAHETVNVRWGSVAAGLRLGVLSFAAILPICVGALVVSVAALQLVKGPIETHPLLQTVQTSREPWVLALATFEAVVLAPLWEEFVYRGVLLTALLRGGGPIAALVVSSALFAVVHVPTEPQALLPIFFLGMALGYAAYRTRSLVAPIIAHALFNGLMVLGTILGSGG
ncbi:MAG: CPBP family intramembrane metalloprotease [Planctomycetes bacterium]|nr:CPBP family intramembrane metalloprotease [Planctomycetota bacterium]